MTPSSISLPQQLKELEQKSLLRIITAQSRYHSANLKICQREFLLFPAKNKRTAVLELFRTNTAKHNTEQHHLYSARSALQIARQIWVVQTRQLSCIQSLSGHGTAGC